MIPPVVHPLKNPIEQLMLYLEFEFEKRGTMIRGHKTRAYKWCAGKKKEIKQGWSWFTSAPETIAPRFMTLNE